MTPKAAARLDLAAKARFFQQHARISVHRRKSCEVFSHD